MRYIGCCEPFNLITSVLIALFSVVLLLTNEYETILSAILLSEVVALNAYISTWSSLLKIYGLCNMLKGIGKR